MNLHQRNHETFLRHGRCLPGGTKLLLWWWIFALTAAALAPLAVLVAGAREDASGTLAIVGATLGVLAGLVQLLCLIR